MIERIMCHGMVDSGDVGKAHNIDFADYFAPELRRLRGYEDDGLVQTSETGIEVTPVGRLLLRSVACVFDRYLPAVQTGNAPHARVI